MKVKSKLIAITACLVAGACAQEPVNRPVNDERNAIETCYDTFVKKAGLHAVESVDRVYVVTDGDDHHLLFTHEEVGLFGDRSENYFSVFGCAVLDTPVPHIYFLAESLGIPLIGSYQEINEPPYRYPNRRVSESLYLLREGEFTFADSIKYNLAEYEKMMNEIADKWESRSNK